jgi:membrane-associated phospholipid phosphatase
MLLLWGALALALAGLASLLVDVRAAEFFRAHLVGAARRRVRLVTDVAKGAHWLAAAFLIYGGVQLWMAIEGETPGGRHASDLALALLVSMVAASAILHSIKLLLGRRRPRDHFEHGLYGLRWLALDTQYDSFPSGHAVTIFCVATIASAALPQFAPAWFAIAAFLALTRALLTSHYLSDVLIGAALGLIVARETLILLFPQLVPGWF